jgi:hypothetical protein
MVGEKRKYETYCEWKVSENHPVDTMWHVGEEIHVFEVVVHCESNLYDHISCCFANPRVTRVTIIRAQKKELDEIKKRLLSEPLLKSLMNKVFFQPVSDFEKELWP